MKSTLLAGLSVIGLTLALSGAAFANDPVNNTGIGNAGQDIGNGNVNNTTLTKTVTKKDIDITIIDKSKTITNIDKSKTIDITKFENHKGNQAVFSGKGPVANNQLMQVVTNKLIINGGDGWAKATGGDGGDGGNAKNKSFVKNDADADGNIKVDADGGKAKASADATGGAGTGGAGTGGAATGGAATTTTGTIDAQKPFIVKATGGDATGGGANGGDNGTVGLTKADADGGDAKAKNQTKVHLLAKAGNGGNGAGGKNYKSGNGGDAIAKGGSIKVASNSFTDQRVVSNFFTGGMNSTSQGAIAITGQNFGNTGCCTSTPQ
jgi:hypothetical protein